MRVLLNRMVSWWREATKDFIYHPELHYMRGPGPAWHSKHGSH